MTPPRRCTFSYPACCPQVDCGQLQWPMLGSVLIYVIHSHAGSARTCMQMACASADRNDGARTRAWLVGA